MHSFSGLSLTPNCQELWFNITLDAVKMHILRPLRRPAASESLRTRPGSLHFSKPFRCILGSVGELLKGFLEGMPCNSSVYSLEGASALETQPAGLPPCGFQWFSPADSVGLLFRGDPQVTPVSGAEEGSPSINTGGRKPGSDTTTSTLAVHDCCRVTVRSQQSPSLPWSSFSSSAKQGCGTQWL